MDKVTKKVYTSNMIGAVAQLAGITKKQAEDAIKASVQFIVSATKSGTEVQIHGLGTFKPKDRAEKTGRNPKTGESIQIPAKRVLTFKPALAVKEL